MADARKSLPELIVLDLLLPTVDGLEVCRLLKGDSKTQHIPIIMLTAKSEEADIVSGLELGADDYLTKPFSPRVLLARIKALLRRKPDSADDSASIRVRELMIHPGRHEVLIDGQPVDLTYTEFKLLHFLAQAGLGIYTLANRRRREGGRLPGNGTFRRRAGRWPAEKARRLRSVYRNRARRWLPFPGVERL